MKFMFFFYPAITATMDEREKLRPIAARTDRFQQMLEEIVELSQLAEEVGFSAVTFPEHHLHGEGGEMGSLPVLTQHVLANTRENSRWTNWLCSPRLEPPASRARNGVDGPNHRRTNDRWFRSRLPSAVA